VLVLVTASSEGKGFHSLLGEDMRLFAPFGHTKLYSRIIEGKKLVVFSPNLSSADIGRIYPQGILVQEADELMSVLQEVCPAKEPTVAVFPSASNQIASA
jgi:hypothetical protein